MDSIVIMKYNVTPKYIKELSPRQIFVFGSNLSGIHGAGSAKLAKEKFGAIQYQGIGLQGQSYGIPTKDKKIQTLPLSEIEKYVMQFYEFASDHPHLIFLVVEVGCMLAGYKPSDIASLPGFIKAYQLRNVYLPQSFIDVISQM